MSRDTKQFLTFLAAILLPAFLAGSAFNERWARGHELVIFGVWLFTTLAGVGYAADGFGGSKRLITGTVMTWTVIVAAALFLGMLVDRRSNQPRFFAF